MSPFNRARYRSNSSHIADGVSHHDPDRATAVGEDLAIVLNGELYNYRELRAELVHDGYAFQTQSDTEVLLRLYARDGEAMLSRLNGIFAFAVWDVGKRGLFLARDGRKQRGAHRQVGVQEGDGPVSL